MSNEVEVDVEMITWFDASDYIDAGEVGDGLIIAPEPRVDVGDALCTSDQEHVVVTKVLERNPTCQTVVTRSRS